LKPDRTGVLLILASILPVAALAVGGTALLLGRDAGAWLSGWLGLVFFLLTALTGVAALALGLLLKRAGGEVDLWRREVAGMRDLLRKRDAELRTLRGEVEILTAVREIGVIVNADDEFESVLSKVMEVVGEALKAEDLVLFLVDRSSKSLEPVVRRREGKSAFRRGLKKSTIGRRNVEEALIHGRLLEEQEWNGYSFALPLVVEREAVGVLKAFLPPPPPGEAVRVEEARRFLRGVERHLALAIKTPSLYNKAVLDGLTGLYTRRHLDTQIEGYFGMCVRRGIPLSFILGDIDHFKSINDTHGHPSGDRILKGVAKVVMREIRKYDSAYRYGGEEICVLLPETGAADALEIAERIRFRIERKPFRGDKGQSVSVTLSLGVASFRDGMKAPAELVASADEALYRAKGGGRNRVEVGEGSPSAKTKKKRRKPMKKGGRKTGGRKTPRRRGRKKRAT
jgi:diguanylate cyclase (GGDEF)-like protein